MSEPILICSDGSAGFGAEPRGERANDTWEGIGGVADGRPVPIVPPPR